MLQLNVLLQHDNSFIMIVVIIFFPAQNYPDDNDWMDE